VQSALHAATGIQHVLQWSYTGRCTNTKYYDCRNYHQWFHRAVLAQFGSLLSWQSRPLAMQNLVNIGI
jgi:hypothetical protein